MKKLFQNRIAYFLRKKMKWLRWLTVRCIEGKRLLTIHERPLYAADYHKEPDVGDYSDTAILIQGPILKKRKFTEDTVKLYQRQFPKAHIILSTWEDEKTSLSPDSRTHILFNNPRRARNAGPHNLNLQLTSTLEGIDYARKIGINYVLKTRTDQRFYHPRLLGVLHMLLQRFPAAQSSRKRIIGFGSVKMWHTPYYLPDMFLFGDIQDMDDFWRKNFIGKDTPYPEGVTAWTGNYLLSQFLISRKRNLAWTLEDSFKAAAEYCIFVGPELLDWYWYKYARTQEYRSVIYSRPRKLAFSFFDWLDVYYEYFKKQ